MRLTTTPLTIGDLEAALARILRAAQDDALKADLRRQFQALRPHFDGQKIGYCLGRFIGAELDLRTPGMRGLGRVTDRVPRLGGYHRERLRRLPPHEMVQLHELIAQLMLSAYLVSALLSDDPAGIVLTSPVDLFHAWIPQIYVTGSFGPTSQAALEELTARKFTDLLAFMRTHNMRGGRFLRRDLTPVIFYYYAIAGAGLGLEERNPHHEVPPPEELVLSYLLWARQGGPEAALAQARELLTMRDLDRAYLAARAAALGVEDLYQNLLR